MKNNKTLYLIAPLILIVLGLYMMYAAISGVDFPKSLLLIYSLCCLVNSLIVYKKVRK